MTDRSEAGKQRIAERVRADLALVNAVDTSRLPYPTRTSFEVVRSAYATALEGFALPYGDITVGSWRNTPYVVIQNVGAYLDIPRFLDSDHLIEPAAKTPRRTSRGCSRTPSSSTANSVASRRRMQRGWCRRRSCSTRRWRS